MEAPGIEASLDSRLRRALRRVAATVTIVSVRGAKDHGMTATAVAAVSLLPPSILVVVNRSASIHRPLVAASEFCVNVLAADQEHQARIFGAHATAGERFADRAWARTERGVPFLTNAQANLFCRDAIARDHGTHTIFVGQVYDVLCDDCVHPLVYLDGAFITLAPQAA